MKNIFSFAVLLIFCAQCAHLASIPVKRRSKLSGQDVADDFNKFRKGVAEQLNIANMHELIYDEKYENLLTPAVCQFPPKGNFRFFKPTGMDMIVLKLELKRPNPNITNEDLIFVNPTRTRIACAPLATPCKIEFPIGCLIGPGIIISENDVIKGEPGSACPHGKASSGLCAASGGSSIGGHSALLILVVFAFLNLI